MESQNLANISWSFATRCVMAQPLMASIAAAAIPKIAVFGARSVQPSILDTYEFIADLLALAWSLAQAASLSPEVACPLRREVVRLGAEIDAAVRAQALADCGEDGVEEGIDIRLPGVPFARVSLPGIMVVFKPENWEVNRGDPNVHRAEVEWRLLSDWVAAALPRTRCPLVHSSEFDFGFIHRLDVPSSGLIMSAKNFAGLALLRFELDTHELGREYAIVCANPLHPDRRYICDRLTVDKERMKSFVCAAGSPARTGVKSLAFAWPWLDPDCLDTLAVIKISTGRHHQIRAHLTHYNNPVVSDGKYGLRQTTLKDDYIYGDMMWFEQFFGRPVVALFLDSGPNRKTDRKPAAGEANARSFEYPWIRERRLRELQPDTAA
eukprot:NODE_5553_length_1757_cov_12.531288.p1 GENE.NODE_5553_length_1757_cov_12.531288~~NODE_5553_length_1757_cov_12.531288.p1  ORF type:complete len:380 (+),score=88.32 NODE_5553_length_1757_cov_12.531288:542-1681(+)